jgi:hypothetical protein
MGTSALSPPDRAAVSPLLLVWSLRSAARATDGDTGRSTKPLSLEPPALSYPIDAPRPKNSIGPPTRNISSVTRERGSSIAERSDSPASGTIAAIGR